MQVRISAIVPVFNTEKYIRPALDSLLDQTVKFHEIIVINDGSTDTSYEILKEYEISGKIKLLNQNNQGLGTSRNKGVDIAQGDCIYFFDSDDLASPVLVETIQREFASCSDLEIVSFAGKTFYDNECSQVNFAPNYDRLVVGRFSNFYDAALAMDAQKSNYSQACLFVIKKDAIRKNELKFPSCIHEDEAFLLDLMAAVGSSVVLSDKLFNRRVRADSIMTSKKNEGHVNGYLHASSVAKKYAIKSDLLSRKNYFYKKSLQFYLSAISISYQVNNFHLYNSAYKRLADLPTWKLSFRQLVSLLLGKNAILMKAQLNRFRQSMQG